jgi:anti-sigma-K factor RskA
MNRLERDLRESLKRREPPPGFADRVLARAHATDTSAESRQWRPAFGSWRWQAAVALLVVAIGVGLFVQEQRQRAENERRKDQLIAGLEITASKLVKVQKRLANIDLHLEQQ